MSNKRNDIFVETRWEFLQDLICAGNGDISLGDQLKFEVSRAEMFKLYDWYQSIELGKGL